MVTAIDPRLSQLGLTVNDQLMDRALRHSIFLRRLQTHEANRVVAFMDKHVLPDMLGRVQRRLEVIARRGFDTGPITTTRLRKMTTEIGVSLTAGMGEARKRFAEGLLDIASHEASIEADALSRAVAPLREFAPTIIETTVPSAGLIREVVFRRPFQGKILREWFSTLAKTTQRSVMQQVKIGLVEGDSLGSIMTRVRGTGAIPGVGRTARRQALAISRTAVTHVTTFAREATYEANKRLIQGVRWVSTLDAKTTDICWTLDGKVFPVGEGQRPPALMGCRSGTSPVVKTLFELGLTNKQIDVTPRGMRASFGSRGPAAIPRGVKGPDFLRRQSIEFQEEVLGKGRAALFRRGKVSFDKFVDFRGRPTSLHVLKDLEARLTG